MRRLAPMVPSAIATVASWNARSRPSATPASPDSAEARGRRREREDSGDDGADGETGGSRKRRRSRKGLDKKFECPHEGCGKSYSRAEHLYRHQLNRTSSALQLHALGLRYNPPC